MIRSPLTDAMIGNIYQSLTVLERAPDNGRFPMVKVQCKCGRIVNRKAMQVRNGHHVTCGCRLTVQGECFTNLATYANRPRFKGLPLSHDLVGLRNSHLTVMPNKPSDENYLWLKCDCGNLDQYGKSSFLFQQVLNCGANCPIKLTPNTQLPRTLRNMAVPSNLTT